MNKEIKGYNQALEEKGDKKIADLLAKEIDAGLVVKAKKKAAKKGDAAAEEGVTSKVWHRHPVWFIDGNPIVGYSKEKRGVRLMFWSGADFGEKKLDVVGEKFKDASIFYNAISEVDVVALAKWLKKAVKIQWDYKNIVKRKGKLERIS
jgi:hypothetical protein